MDAFLRATVLHLVVANRGVESGVLANASRRANRLFQTRRWRLAEAILRSLTGVNIAEWWLTVTEVTRWSAMQPRPRGRQLAVEELWHFLGDRFPRQVQLLLMARGVRTSCWLEESRVVDTEEVVLRVAFEHGRTLQIRQQAVKIPVHYREAEEAAEVVSVSSGVPSPHTPPSPVVELMEID